MKKLFLLDAYALIYRAYYAFIRNPRINSKGENTSAIFGFVNTLQDVLKKENPDYIGVAFDPKGGTFRHEADPSYKAQREETPEAIRFAVPYIKEIIEAFNIPVIEVPRYEADDVIGTLATLADKAGLLTYMMTPDKDYGQLVTEHVLMYKPKLGDKDFELLGVDEVVQKYGIERPEQVIDLLGLMGDAADNIPGCPGVGEKTAVKLIQQFGSVEQLLQNTDQLKGALKKKVEENKDKITHSKFMATIVKDVPIQLNLDQLQRKEPDEQKLRSIFERLEFRALIDRVLNKTTPPSAKKQPVEASLFDIFPTDVQEDSKNQNLSTLQTVPHAYQLIDNEQGRRKLLDYLLTFDFLSLDTETTSTTAMEANLVGLSFAVKPHEAFYVPIPSNNDEAQRIVNVFKPLYENANILKIGQNIKYDMLVLSNYGIELAGNIFDTMIAHYVLQPELHHGMDYLAEIYLNYRTVHIEELIGEKGKTQKNMRDLPPSAVYEYACEDADITLQLKEKLDKELKEKDAAALAYDIEFPLIPVLATMERNGVCLDTEGLKEVSVTTNQKALQIEQEIHQLAGEPFNIASPKQVGEVLFNKMKIVDKPKKTKTGQYVTSEAVLESLAPQHPIVEKILQHRKLKKLLSTYIDALPSLINPRTGHIHTSFNQAVTATGRLSSSNPNLQNIPIRDEMGRDIRKAFVPDEGCEFFSADYSQIELRIMAHLSEDEHLIEAFQQGHDIHAATAAKIYKERIEDVTKEQRSKAKTANFGIIYGITVFGLAERMGVSRQEAKELIDGYFASYPKVKEYMDKSIAMAREHGYTSTIFHRLCYLPDIHSHNAVVRGYAERNAINAPIQGSAADLVKVAMINIHRRFKQEGLLSKMIIQVHDELNFSVVPAEKEQVQRIVLEEMERAYPLRVPLKADCGWGKNWLEAH